MGRHQRFKRLFLAQNQILVEDSKFRNERKALFRGCSTVLVFNQTVQNQVNEIDAKTLVAQPGNQGLDKRQLRVLRAQPLQQFFLHFGGACIVSRLLHERFKQLPYFCSRLAFYRVELVQVVLRARSVRKILPKFL